MVGKFGASSTTEDVLAHTDLSGFRILVTGVSAGVGVEIARALAGHGAQVVSTITTMIITYSFRSISHSRGRSGGPRPKSPFSA